MGMSLWGAAAAAEKGEALVEVELGSAGEGRLEISRSDGSKRRSSSKLAMRKEVSEWALRW